jgi:hypothetical protein
MRNEEKTMFSKKETTTSKEKTTRKKSTMRKRRMKTKERKDMRTITKETATSKKRDNQTTIKSVIKSRVFYVYVVCDFFNLR